MKTITVQDIYAQLQTNASDYIILDVRETDEIEQGHVEGITHIPLALIPLQHEQLPPNATVYCICRSGGRSSMAVQQLEELGYSDVYNVEGGMLEWNAQQLPYVTGTV